MRHPNRPTRLPRRAAVVLHARTTVLLCAALLPTAVACGSSEPVAESAATTTISATPLPTAAAPSTRPTVDPFAGLPLIGHTDWTEAVDGPRLLVYPTSAGRQATFPGTDERAWQEVLEQAPDADTPGMRDQFVCHWTWARLVQPDKPSWNLEPWRPAVGYQATVDARCNPGGLER